MNALESAFRSALGKWQSLRAAYEAAPSDATLSQMQAARGAFGNAAAALAPTPVDNHARLVGEHQQRVDAQARLDALPASRPNLAPDDVIEAAMRFGVALQKHLAAVAIDRAIDGAEVADRVFLHGKQPMPEQHRNGVDGRATRRRWEAIADVVRGLRAGLQSGEAVDSDPDRRAIGTLTDALNMWKGDPTAAPSPEAMGVTIDPSAAEIKCARRLATK